MKTFLLRSFLLLVFMLCCQTNNATSKQTTVWKTSYDTNTSTDSYGNTNKDVRFKFEVTSSGVVAFTHAGSALSRTSMYLLHHLSNGKIQEISFSSDAIQTPIIQGIWKNSNVKNYVEQDLRKMSTEQAFLCESLAEGVYELVSEGTDTGYSNNGDIHLNVYSAAPNMNTIKVGSTDEELFFMHELKTELSTKVYCFF